MGFRSSPRGVSASQIILTTCGVGVLTLVFLPIASLLVQGAEYLSGDAAAVFSRRDTWIALARTLSLGLGVSVLCAGIALPVAWLTHSTDLPGRRIFRVILNLPLAVPSYVSGFVVMACLGQAGWLHELLRPLGVEQMPDVRGGVGATLALLYSFPFALLSLQAALSALDPRGWEAARSLGASPWAAWRQVIFPQLRAPLAAGSLLIALYAVGDFGAVSLLRYKSLSYVIYLRQDSLSESFRQEAIFLAILLVLVAVALVFASQRTREQVDSALSAQSQGRAWPTIPLGRWKWPSFLFCAAVAFCGVALPVLVILRWLWRGFALGHELPIPSVAALTTLAVGLIGASVVAMIAIAPALLSRFGSRRTSASITLVTYIGYALPGIVVAIAIVTVVTEHFFSLYQTVHLLLLAYAIRFLPLAVHTFSDALHRQNTGIYDAARSLGCSPAQAWWRVILPASRAALWFGWLAVFIAVIKELPITLLLSPIEIGASVLESPPRFETLSTRIWTLTADEYFSEVSIVVLLLLLIATAGLIAGQRRAEHRSRRSS